MPTEHFIDQCAWCGKVYAPKELESDEGFTAQHDQALERRTGHAPTGQHYPAPLPPHGTIYHPAPSNEDEDVGQGICERCKENSQRALAERRQQATPGKSEMFP